jgi:hypothetical protein
MTLLYYEHFKGSVGVFWNIITCYTYFHDFWHHYNRDTLKVVSEYYGWCWTLQTRTKFGDDNFLTKDGLSVLLYGTNVCLSLLEDWRKPGPSVGIKARQLGKSSPKIASWLER